jgi:hypothetical protein
VLRQEEEVLECVLCVSRSCVVKPRRRIPANRELDVQHGVLAQRLVTQSLMNSVTHQQWTFENPFMSPAYVYRRNFADECLH